MSLRSACILLLASAAVGAAVAQDCTPLGDVVADKGLDTLGAVAGAVSEAGSEDRAAGIASALGSEPVGAVVFAPTEEAFGNALAFLNTTPEDLLGPDGINTAASILDFHIHLPDEADFMDGITMADDNSTVAGPCNNASVVESAPVCSGMAYVIDTVLLPGGFCEDDNAEDAPEEGEGEE